MKQLVVVVVARIVLSDEHIRSSSPPLPLANLFSVEIFQNEILQLSLALMSGWIPAVLTVILLSHEVA
jgi:hypothetical protein